MKTLFTILICLCTVVLGNAQYNLVRNYSFEENVVCPSPPFNNPLPSPWLQPSSWSVGAFAHRCSTDTGASVPFQTIGGKKSYQYPKTGNGLSLIGIIAGSPSMRYYVQQKLKDSLQKNKCYYTEFWISLCNPMKYACNNAGALFTKAAISALNLNLIPGSPQVLNYNNPIINDTMNWVKISGVFTTQGGEQYITLGNFFDITNTNTIVFNGNGVESSEYYIDDISVFPLDSIILKADAGQDKNITLGDSTFIGSYTNGLTGVRWFNNLGQEIITKAGIPGFFVKPLVSTFYVIEQNVCGQYSKDTVNVNVSAMPLRFMMYDVRFTNMNGSQFPSFGGVRGGLIENKWSTSNEVSVSHFNIQRSENGLDFRTIAKLFAKNNIINDYAFEYSSPPLEGLGVVYFRIEAVDFDGKKNYSQIRSIAPSIGEVRGGFIIYPNPTRDYVTIQSKEKIREVKIINQLGQIVKVETINHTSCIINCTSLHKGIYTLLITTQKGDNYNKKLLIK